MKQEIRTAMCGVFLAAVRAREEGRANVFVDYQAHVDLVCIRVNPISQEYRGEAHIQLMSEDVKLSGIRAPSDAELLIWLDDIRHQIDGLDTRELVDDLGREWA